MPKRLREGDSAAIVDVVRQNTNGVRRSDISDALKGVPQRTLQYWLKSLVEKGRLAQEGKGPAARYRFLAAAEEPKEKTARRTAPGEEKPEGDLVPLSAESENIRQYLRQPSAARKAVGYNRQFLDSYRPNTSYYLSQEERVHLAEVGKTTAVVEAAGTYAKQILNRLRQLVGDVVRGKMEKEAAAAHIAEWVKENVTADERETFREMAESDLLNLHEGNFARLQVRPSEFAAWQLVWGKK